MQTILIIGVYLLGCICSYLFGRWANKNLEGKWTVGDRITFLLYSILSWATLYVWVIIYFESIDKDKPASW